MTLPLMMSWISYEIMSRLPLPDLNLPNCLVLLRRKWYWITKTMRCAAWRSGFCPDQVLLSKNFHSRPGCRRKIRTKEIWGCTVVQNGVFGKQCFCPLLKQVVLTKNGKNDDLRSTHRNKGLCSSDPGNRRKWRKWRVPLRQNHRLLTHRFRHPEIWSSEEHPLTQRTRPY